MFGLFDFWIPPRIRSGVGMTKKEGLDDNLKKKNRPRRSASFGECGSVVQTRFPPAVREAKGLNYEVCYSDCEWCDTDCSGHDYDHRAGRQDRCDHATYRERAAQEQ